MVSVKCPLSYSEQIERLKNFHKMKIEDDNQAKEILQKINYYRLSGYGIGLLSSSNKDEYREGISLQHLFRLYKFDSVLKNALMHVIEQIEIQLSRNSIKNSDFICTRYEIWGFRLFECYKF